MIKHNEPRFRCNTLTTDEFKMLVMEAVRNGAKAEGYDDITKYSKYATFAASDFFGEANTPWMKYIMRDGSKHSFFNTYSSTLRI